MTLGLRAGLSFCTIRERIIFLDTSADRYFCLSPAMDHLFRSWQRNAEAFDRDQVELAGLRHQRVLVEGGHTDTAPAFAQAPTQEQGHCPPAGIPLVESVRAIWKRRALSRNLETLGFERTLEGVRRAKEVGGVKRSLSFAPSMARIAAAHRVADLAWSAHDQCLPRALALGHDLMARGQDCQFVIGVALRPFQAHCWVQAATCLLNDDLETIRTFTPILVI